MIALRHPRPWPRWNLRVTTVFGPVLIITGLVGLAFPDLKGLLSHAIPYDIFHIVFGVLAVGIALGRVPAMASLFNLGFGLIDLYQAAAGLAGVFPSHLFRYLPGDHVAHIVLGLLLAAIGLAGLRRPPA